MDYFDPNSYNVDQSFAQDQTPAYYPTSTDYGALADQYGQAVNSVSQPTDTTNFADPYGQGVSALMGTPVDYGSNVPAQTQQTPTVQQGPTSGQAGYGPQQPETPGVFSKLMQGLGIQNKSGEIDYSDPKVLDKLLKAISIGGAMYTTMKGPQNKKSATELAAQFKTPFDNFNPVQQASANTYFGSPYARHALAPANTMPSPIVPGQKYAEGGQVDNAQDAMPTGALSLVRGSDPGQADTVKANLSHGEYVFDADTVAALGDGNNEAGAKILDKWREELRRQKRAAPIHEIPPKSKAPTHYLGKVK